MATRSLRGGRLGRLLAGLQDLERRYRAWSQERFPDIPRRVSGYNLDELAPERGFHVARALVGTESTCAFTTEATLRLVTSPAQRCLVVLGYPDVFAAAEAVPELLAHPLLALEGFDRTLVDQMEAHGLNADGVALLPDGNGWLLAELGGETRRRSGFPGCRPGCVPSRRASAARQVGDPATQRQLWAVRESGLGATAIRLDGHHNYEGWEDGAVPPGPAGRVPAGDQRLVGQARVLRRLVRAFRPGLRPHPQQFRPRQPRGAAPLPLVRDRGRRAGRVAGRFSFGRARRRPEPGRAADDDVRPRAGAGVRRVQGRLGPRGADEPGQGRRPLPARHEHPLFRPAASRSTLRPTGYSFAKDDGSLMHAALRCVGVGRCRRDDAATMCPSYRATRDEVHSTRGRAKVLTEMFQGDMAPASTWRNEEVREALDLCLSCKACASDCPTHVDMATYKSEFYSHYYKGRLRPAAMYAMGLLPWAARAATASAGDGTAGQRLPGAPRSRRRA